MLDEMQEHGHVIDPKDAKERKVSLPDARTLDNEYEYVLLVLHEHDFHRSLASYKYSLQVTTGTIGGAKQIQT